MRLIDADALIAETMKNRCADCDRRKGVKKGKITFLYDFGEAPCRACDVGDMIDTLDEAPTVGDWISVQDRLPAEKHSIFFRFYGTNNWSKSMWRENSDKVLVTVVFKDGSKKVTTGETHDGIWNTTISRTLDPVVTHWAELPEPPKEESNA